jgi:predicted O-methyltransferase YrrM
VVHADPYPSIEERISMTTASDTLQALLTKLHDESEAQTLARARAQYRGTDAEFSRLAEQYGSLAPRLRGQFLEAHGLSSEDVGGSPSAELSLAVSAGMGSFLRNMALARRARRVLELGSSFGVSTLYFADALRLLGEGTVVATEFDRAKCARLRAHVEEAGLVPHVDLREGDVFRTTTELEGSFDLVFIDVWADRYLALFQKIEGLLRPGSVVLTDNMFTAGDSVRSFKHYLDGHPGLASTTLDFESGVEFTVVV